MSTGYTIEVFHEALPAPLTADFDTKDEALAAVQTWNNGGYNVRAFAGDLLIADLPASTDTGLARFDRDLALIQTVDEAIERLVSVRVTLDTTD